MNSIWVWTLALSTPLLYYFLQILYVLIGKNIRYVRRKPTWKCAVSKYLCPFHKTCTTLPLPGAHLSFFANFILSVTSEAYIVFVDHPSSILLHTAVSAPPGQVSAVFPLSPVDWKFHIEWSLTKVSILCFIVAWWKMSTPLWGIWTFNVDFYSKLKLYSSMMIMKCFCRSAKIQCTYAFSETKIIYFICIKCLHH